MGGRLERGQHERLRISVKDHELVRGVKVMIPKGARRHARALFHITWSQNNNGAQERRLVLIEERSQD